MQISKIIKWLPVVLSVLGALGYSSRDTELIRTGVSVAATLAQGDNIGLEKVNEWLGENVVKATSDTKAEAKPKSEQKQKSSRQSYTYNGKIIKIHDGDTMHIIDSDGRKHKIRMAYIDAPEINQAYGTQSRDNLIDAALNKKAKVRVFEADRYQREVAQVSVGTIDLNLMQIRDGAAWHYESYAKNNKVKPPTPTIRLHKNKPRKNVKVYGKKTIRKSLGNFAVKTTSSRTVIKSSLINNGLGFGRF